MDEEGQEGNGNGGGEIDLFPTLSEPLAGASSGKEGIVAAAEEAERGAGMESAHAAKTGEEDEFASADAAEAILQQLALGGASSFLAAEE
jgi:hypothetical protein